MFFLRSVAPGSVKSSDIYWGAVPFVGIQIIMIALVIAFPQMVTVNLDKGSSVDVNSVKIEIPAYEYNTDDNPAPAQ